METVCQCCRDDAQNSFRYSTMAIKKNIASRRMNEVKVTEWINEQLLENGATHLHPDQ